MNVKLINAEDVKVGMYIEGSMGWWEIERVTDEKYRDAYGHIVVSGKPFSKRLSTGALALVGIPE